MGRCLHQQAHGISNEEASWYSNGTIPLTLLNPAQAWLALGTFAKAWCKSKFKVTAYSVFCWGLDVSYYCSVAQLCPTLSDPMDCSMPGFPVLHSLPEFAETHVH